MARPHKIGLDYYSTDVDIVRNIKIQKLLRHHKGPAALGVLIGLFSQIYGHGYYILWDDDQRFLLSRDLFFDEDYIQEIIDACLGIGIFDSNLYGEHQILTSRGIQQRYVLATTRRQMDNYPLPYMYPDIKRKLMHTETELMLTETELMLTESTQSKVKKSKVKNNNPLTPLEGESDESDPVPGSGDILSADSPSADEDPMRVNNPVGYETMDLSFVDDNFRKVFFQFLEYKRVDHRFKFKSAVSLKTCYNRLVRFAENDPQKAALIVETCIANGWKGFFEEKNIVAYGNVKQPTAKERINAGLAKGAEYAKGILARNNTSVCEGVSEKVW